MADKGGEEQEKEAAASRLPTGDRVAYYQLATASGALRADSAERARDHAGLGAALARLRRLRPADRDLRLARAELRAAIGARLRGRGSGAAALRASDRVNRRLSRYVRRHAAAGVLVPD